MSKKLIAVLLTALLLTGLIVGCGGKTDGDANESVKDKEQKAENVFVTIATGGTAGTYFPLGGALAEIWTNNISNVNSTAQTTGASVANVNLLRNGEVEVIFVQNDIAYYAANGIEMFQDNKYEDIKGLATLYPETIQIITLEGKKIDSLADLKGKKVAVGAAGSGTEANARQILEAAGITYDDISIQYLSFSEAANNLKDGNVDAAFVTAGFPTAAVQDIAAQHKVKLLAVDDALADKLIEKYPFYVKTVIPADTYNGMTEDVKAVSVMSMLAVSSNLDEEIAYNLLKTMYENPDRLKVAHSMGALIKAETGRDGMSIDLHPGADKYFKEGK
ncbi:TAXI family TRAP transporter solute-binding subunit [Tepidanaerobacter sp. EBM-38]|uniref:TAXI family TRAP transporter solute-binding subunit n=1 Tax=Tepidanaerobacter sp. EBM-38 TaxID=1918496 RepID=UPI000A957F5A|nr:TAXI family TRAP transporter solute-binding subunit [Tepidanaerobacter sp. EBM-38]